MSAISCSEISCSSYLPLNTPFQAIEINIFQSYAKHVAGFIHYDDVIMGVMASQITSLTTVYSTVYSGTDQRKHKSNAESASIWWRHHVEEAMALFLFGWLINLTCSTGRTSNGSWCMGIKGEMSGTVCVPFTWYMYIYIWVVYSFCLFCWLFIIVTTQFVALYKPCKLKPKPSTYDPDPPPGQPPPGRDPKADT